MRPYRLACAAGAGASADALKDIPHEQRCKSPSRAPVVRPHGITAGACGGAFGFHASSRAMPSHVLHPDEVGRRCNRGRGTRLRHILYGGHGLGEALRSTPL